MITGEHNDAVLFFHHNQVVKEILYPEFEALLDHVVGIEEFKASQVKAVYVRINPTLKITAAVFFLIDFDAEGYADRNWNIPLQHLVVQAGTGADLGAGPIKLSCRSQCSVSWHQRSLWDPEVDVQLKTFIPNTFQVIKQAVAKNRLGLIVEKNITGSVEDTESQSTSSTAKHTASNEQIVTHVQRKTEEIKLKQDLEEKHRQLMEEQKLRISTMKAKTQNHIENIQRKYLLDIIRYREALEATKQLFSEEKHKNLQLKKMMGHRTGDLQQQRESFQQKVLESQQVEQGQLLELEQKYELELRVHLDKATAELKERLDMREVELFYRDEQIGRLNEDVVQLRKDKQSLLSHTGNQMLHKMVEAGISFIAYQPGIDPLTVPLLDMSDYLESPIAFIAAHRCIDERSYRLWLEHFELPVCQHALADGSRCTSLLDKVEKPNLFIEGESDRCIEHRSTQDLGSAQDLAINKDSIIESVLTNNVNVHEGSQ